MTWNFCHRLQMTVVQDVKLASFSSQLKILKATYQMALLKENSRRISIESAIYIFKRSYHASNREKAFIGKSTSSERQFYQRPVASMYIQFNRFLL